MSRTPSPPNTPDIPPDDPQQRGRRAPFGESTTAASASASDSMVAPDVDGSVLQQSLKSPPALSSTQTGTSTLPPIVRRVPSGGVSRNPGHQRTVTFDNQSPRRLLTGDGSPRAPPALKSAHSRQESLVTPTMPKRAASFLLTDADGNEVTCSPGQQTLNVNDAASTSASMLESEAPMRSHNHHHHATQDSRDLHLDPSVSMEQRAWFTHRRETSMRRLRDRVEDDDPNSDGAARANDDSLSDVNRQTLAAALQGGCGFASLFAAQRTRDRTSHHRRVSSYMSSNVNGAIVEKTATGVSGHFPGSDFHRRANAGSLTVLSEMKEGRKRVFMPGVVTIAMGDAVLFRWFGNHTLVQVDDDGLPIDGGLGRNQVPRKGAELYVEFQHEGTYRFESFNHPGCLRAQVVVRPRRRKLAESVCRITSVSALVFFLVLGITLGLFFFVRSRYLVAPDAPTDGSSDGNGAWRVLEDIVKERTFPWFVAGMLLMLLVVCARILFCFVPVRITDFGRGFGESHQMLVQAVAAIIATWVIIAVGAGWVYNLMLSHGFATLFSVILGHVRSLVNEAIAMIADIRFLIATSETPTAPPASAIQMLADVDGVSASIRDWTDVGEDLIRAVFRVTTLLVFAALHIYLVMSAGMYVGVRRRRATSMNAAFWFAIIGTTSICITIGITSLLQELVERTLTTARGFADGTLTVDDAKGLTGASDESAFVQFLVSCSADGDLSVQYIDSRVSQAVGRWNELAPDGLLLAVRDDNTTAGVVTLNQYMTDIVSQVQNIQTQLASNTSLLSRSLREEYDAVLIPTLQASLRIARTVLSLVDCRVLREVFAKIVPVLEEQVSDVLDTLVWLEYFMLGGLFFGIICSAVGAHVFDRPYKFWCEPQTGRWFRFRASYLAHRRLLLRALLEQREEQLAASMDPSQRHHRVMSGGSDSIYSAHPGLRLARHDRERASFGLPSSLPPLTFDAINNTGGAGGASKVVHDWDARGAPAHGGGNTDPDGNIDHIPSKHDHYDRADVAPVDAANPNVAAVLMGLDLDPSITFVDKGAAAASAANDDGQDDDDDADDATVASPSDVRVDVDDEGFGSNGELDASAIAPLNVSAAEHRDAEADVDTSESGSVVDHGAAPTEAAAGRDEDIQREYSEVSATQPFQDMPTRQDSAMVRQQHRRMFTSDTALMHTMATVPGSALTTTTGTEWPEPDALAPEVAPKWRSPPKCVLPSVISGCYQVSLLSGLMMLFEAALLLALHRSYSDNRLPPILLAAVGCCLAFPWLTYLAEFTDDARCRAGGRLFAWCTAATALGLLVYHAQSSYRFSEQCFSESQDSRANATSLMTLSDGCGIDETLRRTEQGVYSNVVAFTCFVAVLAVGTLVIYSGHRVGDFIAVLFQEAAVGPAVITCAAVRRRVQLWEQHHKLADVPPPGKTRGRGGAASQDDEGWFAESAMGADAVLGESKGGKGDSLKVSTKAGSAVGSSINTVDSDDLDSNDFDRLQATRIIGQHRSRNRRRRCAVLGTIVMLTVAVVATILVIVMPQLQNGADDPSANGRHALGCNGYVDFCDRRIDELVWLTTHNSFSALEDDYIGPNHYFGMRRQLTDGVRAFMIDVHNYSATSLTPSLAANASDLQPALCHGDCRAGVLPLQPMLRYFTDFLIANPREVVVFLLEQYVADELLWEAVRGAELSDRMWVPPAHAAASVGGNWSWPTLRELVDSGKQVIWITDIGNDTETVKADPRRSVEAPWMLYMWDFMFETPFTPSKIADFSCSREVRRQPNATFEGRLSILNHFLTTIVGAPFLAAKANPASVMNSHFYGCQNQWGSLPNFFAVDFYSVEDTISTVRELNFPPES